MSLTLPQNQCGRDDRQSWGVFASDHDLMDEHSNVSAEASAHSSRRFGRSEMTTGVYRDVFERELRKKSFPLQFTLFRRQALERIGFFPEYGRMVPDFALFLELGVSGVQAYYIAERLGRYRVHSRQQTCKRVENSESLVHCFEQFIRSHSLNRTELSMISSMYRTSVIELAVAHAHNADRKTSLKTLAHYTRFGWGGPPLRRLLVLTALWLGVRPAGTNTTG